MKIEDISEIIDVVESINNTILECAYNGSGDVNPFLLQFICDGKSQCNIKFAGRIIYDSEDNLPFKETNKEYPPIEQYLWNQIYIEIITRIKNQSIFIYANTSDGRGI